MDIICFVNTEHILQNHGEQKLRRVSGTEKYTLHDWLGLTLFLKPRLPVTPSTRFENAGLWRKGGGEVQQSGVVTRKMHMLRQSAR